MTNRSNYDITYPRKGRIRFNGGLSNTYDKVLIEENESPDCLNVVFDTNSVETRGGATTVNTTSVGSFPGEGLYTRHNSSDSTQTMVAFWNGTMYTLGTTTFVTVPSAQSIFTAGGRVCATEYEDYLFVGNGYSIPHKYNGTAFTRHGVYPPQSAPVAATSTTGILSGDYNYKVTYVNSASVEGDVSSASATWVGAAECASVTVPIGAASFGVDARRLYRKSPGDSDYKLITTISDNVTSAYVDNVSAGTTTAPTDKGVPPLYSTVCYHKDRIFCNDPANPNYVVYSDLAEPFTFGANNYIRAGDATGDLVREVTVGNDAILVNCDNSQWMIYMPDTTAANWELVRVQSSFGSKSPFGSVRFDNKIFFPAVQNHKFVGFGALEGAAINPDVTFLTVQAIGSELLSEKIETSIASVVSTYVNRITSFVYKNKIYVALTYGTSATTNNRIFVYDISNQDLSKRQRGGIWVPWTGINACQFCEYNGNLYSQSSVNGTVQQLLTSTYSDDSTAINSYYWTKEFSGDDDVEGWHKDFRKIRLLYEKSGAYYMGFGYRTDSDKGSGSMSNISLSPGGSLWGTMVFGRDNWGGGVNEADDEITLGQVRGKRIQFKFTNLNTLAQKFKVLGLSFYANLKGKR